MKRLYYTLAFQTMSRRVALSTNGRVEGRIPFAGGLAVSPRFSNSPKIGGIQGVEKPLQTLSYTSKGSQRYRVRSRAETPATTATAMPPRNDLSPMALMAEALTLKPTPTKAQASRKVTAGLR